MPRPVRNQPDIDYKIFGETGEKVFKDRGTKISAKMDNLHGKAIDSRSDADDLMSSYTLDELCSEEDLQEFLTKAETIKQEFRRVHSQLQDADGDNFQARYPYYEDQLSKLSHLFKEASKKLSDLRKVNKANADLREFKRMNLQVEKEKLRAHSDRGFFVKQVQWQLEDCKWDDLNDLDEVKSYISAFQSRLDHFYKICSDLEVWLGQEVDTLGFRKENEDFILVLREKIGAGKGRLQHLRSERERLEHDRLVHEQNEKLQAEADLLRVTRLQEEAKINEILGCAESHRFEIKTRSERFCRKCQLDFANLTDHEILDIKKSEENLHVELRELLDKVSCFENMR